MAESVKDLVVRLSFEHGDTKSQIAAIKNETKLLDSGFQAAAASAGGFSGRMNEAAARADLLQKKIALQEQAVQKYGQAMQQAQQRLQEAQNRQADYSKKLEEARQKHADLNRQVDAADKQYKSLKATLGENDSATIAAKENLDALNEETKAAKDETKQWEAALKRSDTAIANADKNLQQLTIAQNQAKASLGKMRSELDGINPKLAAQKAALDAASKSLASYADRAKAAGQAQESVGRTLSKGTAAIVAAGVASAGAAISWESSFADVKKTVSGTEQQLAQLEKQLQQMSTDKPIDSGVLAEIAANAGQLGVSTSYVREFTGVIADLSNTTDLSAESAAKSFAQFKNVTQMQEQYYSNMGSAVVALGNNTATTESAIVGMATNLASAGHQIGLTEAQILGISAALSSLGLEEQAGGTAFSKLFVNMQVAVETGSDALKDFAKVAGMSAKEFKAAFQQDAAGAITAFINGLASGSQSAIVMLDEMGIKETRFRDALLRTTNATELFAGCIDLASSAWQENVALTNEANVRYGTTASKLTMVGNKAKNAAIAFGNDLMPTINKGIDWLDKLVDKFNDLDGEQRKQIMTWAAYAAAIGPGIMMLGKANNGLGTLASGMSKLLGAASAAGGGLNGVGAAIKMLLGPAGIAALIVGIGAGTLAFADWATGAKAAREATEGLVEIARQLKETQATTIYDGGSANPLERFGLNQDSFASLKTTSENWLEDLKAVWADGKKETDSIVSGFVDSFAASSDSVRSQIESRGTLLEGLDALDPDTRAKLDADLATLANYDAEVAALLKKRKNGLLSASDEARLAEVIQLRGELQLEYGGDDLSAYEQVLQGMQAELDRMTARGMGNNADPTLYTDTLNALAEGRRAYNASIDEGYNAQHAQIMAIQDETQRTAALAALNAQYNQQRMEGEQAYQNAVKQVATQAWEANSFEDQIKQIDELAALLQSGELDPGAALNWAQNIDEGKLTSMLALIEQLKASGMSDAEMSTLGIDYDDILGKLTQIRDLSAQIGGDGGNALNSIISEALPEEIQRIMIGLDMTEAAADWAAFADGKDPWVVTPELAAGSDMELNIRLNPLDQATITAWEAANKSVELNGPSAKVGVKLGAGWQSDLQTAFDAGMLAVYGADGAPLPVTPEVLAKITVNDIAAVDADGTIHVLITPKVGTPEAIETTTTAMNSTPLDNTPFAFLSSSAQEDINQINDMAAAAADLRAQIDALMASGSIWTEDGLGLNELQDLERGTIGNLTEQLNALSDTDLQSMADQAANLMAALNSGDLDPATADEYRAQLQSILDMIGAADQYMGTGNQVSAGIAAGMQQYGWSGDAATLADSIRTAIDSSLGVASPAKSMYPTGYNTAAGIGEGMLTYSYAAVAALICSNITSGFSALPAKGYSIGANFGAGLQRGLQSKMASSLALARSYANRITAAFQSAWKIHSPSVIAEGLTWNFGRGLEKGMDSWPTVSERLLDQDINLVHGTMERTAANIDKRQTYNQNATVNVYVDKLDAQDKQDVRDLGYAVAGEVRKTQRGYGKR